MDPLTPLRLGARVALGAAKVATALPRAVLDNLIGDGDDERYRPTATSAGAAGTGPTPGRATSPDDSVQVTTGPPDPTSAAGAAGGVAGTAAAPGSAAAAGSPDPTAATSARAEPIAPQGERRSIDVRATPPPRERSVSADSDVVDSQGGADPAAEVRVGEPWAGYDDMKASEIVRRARSADATVKAVVRLYEQSTKKRKTILEATES
jgi:hypothetical protein